VRRKTSGVWSRYVIETCRLVDVLAKGGEDNRVGIANVGFYFRRISISRTKGGFFSNSETSSTYSGDEYVAQSVPLITPGGGIGVVDGGRSKWESDRPDG